MDISCAWYLSDSVRVNRRRRVKKKQDYAIAISKLKLHTNAAENNSKEIFYAKKEIVHSIQTIKIIISIIIIRNLCIV